MSKAPNVTPEQVAEMVRLQKKGWTQERIAEELGLERMSVCRHLAKYNRAAARRLETRAAEERGRQLDQLDDLYEEARAAWDRSYNAAHLAQARGALADKRAMLGLDAPEQVEHGGEITIRVEYADGAPAPFGGIEGFDPDDPAQAPPPGAAGDPDEM